MKKSLSILMLGVALSFGSVYAQTAAPNPAVAAAQTNLDQAKAALAKAQADATSAQAAATNAVNAVKTATDAVAKANSDLSAAQAAASKPPAPEAQAGIKVLRGAYGMNCRATKPDVTAHLAAACNGKSACTYTVDHNVIGDTAPGCAKDYVVDYVCAGTAGKPIVQRAGIPPEASGKTVQLNCGGSPSAAGQPMNPQQKEKACFDLAKTQAVPGNFMGQFMGGCMAPPKSPPRNQACQVQAQAIMRLAPAQMGGFMNECTSRP